MLDNQRYTVITKPGFGLTVLRAEALLNAKLGIIAQGRGNGMRAELMSGRAIGKLIERQKHERAKAAAIAAAKDRAARVHKGGLSNERRAILYVLKDAPLGLASIQVAKALKKQPTSVSNLLRFMVRDGAMVTPPQRAGGVWLITPKGLEAIQ